MEKKENSNAPKRKKPKKTVITIFSYTLIAISLYLIYGVVKEVYNTVQLRNHLSEVETELNNITAENKRLTTQKEKLEDPDYVQAFARSNYLVSKEGEKVFYLPSSDNTENNK